MAIRVPTVSGPQIADQPLQGAQQRSSASPEMLAGPQHLQQAARAMEEIGGQMQERQNTDRVIRAETEFRTALGGWEAEAKQRRGEQAIGITKDLQTWITDNVRKIGGQLENPAQRSAFDKMAGRLTAQSFTSLATYEADQRRVSTVDGMQASVNSLIDRAAASPQDEQLLQSTSDELRVRVAALSQLQGWTGDTANAALGKTLTQLHKQVMQGLARTDPGAVAAHFERFKDQIDGSQHAELGEFAEKASMGVRAEQAAAEAWATLGPKRDRDAVQLDTIEERIRGQFATRPDIAKMAIASVRERAAAFKDSRRERDQGFEAAVNAAILNGAGVNQIRRMPEFLSLDAEAGRKIVDFLENKTLRAEQVAAARESRAAAAEMRADREQHQQTFAAYLTYSDPTTLAGMSRNQVLNLLPTLGRAHTAKLIDDYDKLQKPGALAAAQIDSDDFNHVVRDFGLLPTNRDARPDEKAAVGELKFRLEQVIDATQRATGKTMTRPEKLQLFQKEMATKVTVDRWGPWNADVPVIMLKPADVANVMVPPADRERITTAMQTRFNATGRPEFAPTEANVKRWYLLSKSKAGGLTDAR